jgi:H+/Cl- antiporter ClcA
LFDNGLYDAERQFCEAIVETQSKRLWYVTVAHIVLASMSLAFVYGTMLALAVLAPQVSTWPLPVFLLLGVTLSVIGLKLAKPVVSRASRRAASFINGCALLSNLLIILGIATIFFRSTQERFLIPDTYKGDVYVLYGMDSH